MDIKSITMHAFGKFHNKTVKFIPGMNVIYGENEIGKSTLHAFIEAMFFGFYKPYSKRKVYEYGYDQYLPWNHIGYSGNLVFEDEGKEFRIERQFLKGKEALDIYEMSTGKNVNQSYDYNRVTHLYEVAKKHFGLNKAAYRNTISLAQMKSRTDEDLVREIKDNMSNMASTHDANISVEKVLKEIEEKKNTIGSKRKKTSPYFKEVEKRRILEVELKKSLEIESNIREAEKEKEALLVEEKSIQGELNELKEKSQELQLIGYQKLYKKIENQQFEIEKLNEELNTLSLYKDFDIEVSGKIHKENEIIKALEQECLHLKSKLNTIIELIAENERIINQYSTQENYDANYSQVNLALTNWRDTEKKVLLLRNNISLIESKDIIEPKVDKRLSLGCTFGAAVFIVLAMSLGVFINPYFYSIGVISLFLLIFAGIANYKENSKYGARRKKFDQWKNDKIILVNQLKEQEDILSHILMEQGVDSIEDLAYLREHILQQQSQAQLKKEQMEEIARKIKHLKDEYNEIESQWIDKNQRLKSRRYSLEKILEAYHIEHEKSISSALEKHMKYEQICKMIDSKRELITELLGEQTLDELKEKISIDQFVESKEDEDEQQLNLRKDQLQNKLTATREAISRVLTESNEWSKSIRSVAEIEEDIEKIETEIKGFERKIEVLDIVKNGIEQIAQNTQNNFAPVLNQALSETMNYISEYKYSDIKVNPKMELTVFDTSLNRTVRAETLSEGTIDMMYFGLRMGISKILSKGKSLPLILDDAFVQYDDQRLNKAVEMLSKQNRQVLLFTCHKREINCLKEQDIEFNIIHL